jgi:hypothetical protein
MNITKSRLKQVIKEELAKFEEGYSSDNYGGSSGVPFEELSYSEGMEVPSPDHGSANMHLLIPNEARFDRWKVEFFDRYGDDGRVEGEFYSQDTNKWSIEGNDKFDKAKADVFRAMDYFYKKGKLD